MPEITKNLAKLMKQVDILLGHLQKDISVIMASGKEIKESLHKEGDEDGGEDGGDDDKQAV